MSPRFKIPKLIHQILIAEYQQFMKQQSTQALNFFIDPLIVSQICRFLTISDRLILSTVNKRLHFLMQEIFKLYIQQQKLYLIPKKTAIHQMRFYFDRCLRIFKINKGQPLKSEYKDSRKTKQIQEMNKKIDKPNQDMLVTTLEQSFKFEVIIYFEVGHIFSCSLNSNGKATIFRTNSLIRFDTKQKLRYQNRFEVQQIKPKGQKLLILKTSGEVFLGQTNKKSNTIVQKERKLIWTIQLSIKRIQSSYNYGIFVPKNSSVSKSTLSNIIFNNEIVSNLQTELEQKGVINLVGMNLSNQSLYLIKIFAHEILEIAIGNKQAYIVNEKYDCIILEFQNINEGQKQIHGKQYKPLQGKKVINIFSGYNFYIALERHIQKIEQWNTQKTLAWMKQIGFEQYIKIARAEKIDGKRLINIQKSYLQNALGINKLNMQQKFMMCIEEIINQKNCSDQIYVWGKNQFGQLGVSHANYIAIPFKIKMSFLKDNEQIDSIFCGWQQSFIRTKKGKIYETIVTSQKKRNKWEDDKNSREQKKQKQRLVQFQIHSENDEQIDQNLVPKFKNKKRKKTQDFKQRQVSKLNKNKRKFQEEDHWIESTAGKAFFAGGYKQFNFYIQCPDQNKFEPIKHKKLRTTKAVLDRILWDEGLNKQQFRIGYIDKDMGVIEISAYEIQMYDYKQNRVKYVKQNNIIIWDRQNKINQFF